MSREIFVHISLVDKNILVGKLWCHSKKGKESASFEYDKTWLAHPEKFALEPVLKLTEGVFHTLADQSVSTESAKLACHFKRRRSLAQSRISL